MNADRTQVKRRKTSFWVALVTAMVPALCWIWLASSFSVKIGDFPAFYTGATLARQGRFATLHDDAQQAKVQDSYIARDAYVKGRPDSVFFVRPHVYAAVLAPLAFLPMQRAFMVWAAVQGIILMMIAWWACRRFDNDALIFLALFPPAILSIGFGQDAVVFLGIAVLSYVLYERGLLLAAGMVLGCGLIKPHLLLLFPLVLLVQKRWRMLAGFALAGALEAAISLALSGIAGAKVYVAFLRKQEGHLTPNPERMLNVHGMMVNLGLENSPVRPVLVMALIVCVIVCVVLVARGSSWQRGLAAAQIGSILVAPHIFMYDSTLLILPALLMYFTETRLATRIAATLFFVPIPYLVQLADKPWTMAPSLVASGLLIALTLATRRDAVPAPQLALVR